MVGTTTDATPTKISGEDHHNQILRCLVRTNTSGQIHFGATATSLTLRRAVAGSAMLGKSGSSANNRSSNPIQARAAREACLGFSEWTLSASRFDLRRLSSTAM